MEQAYVKTGPWIKKPRNLPPGLYVHKRGWAMRVPGSKNPRVIAGKIPPDQAKIIYFQKMAGVPVQMPEKTQQIPLPEQKPVVVLPPPMSGLRH